MATLRKPKVIAPLESTTRATYVAHAPENYKAPTRRGAYSPTSPRSAARASDDNAEIAAAARAIDTKSLSFGHYSTDQSVTIYTQRLVEGAFPISAVRNPAAPFGRSTTFTNPIGEGEKAHADANDHVDVDHVTTLGSSLRATGLLAPTSAAAATAAIAAAPGADLALHQLFNKLKRGCGGVSGGVAQFVAGLSAAAEAAGGAADVMSQAVPAGMFRAAAHAKKLPLTEREIEAVIASVSTPAGDVSLGALLSALA